MGFLLRWPVPSDGTVGEPSTSGDPGPGLAEGNRFLSLGDMTARIQGYCQETGQAVPQAKGGIIRCFLESLALEHRRAAEELEDLVSFRLPSLHVVGGDPRNDLLNQFTADAAVWTIVAGPAEATATGNVLVQALAAGEIGTLADGRDLLRRSSELTIFEPSRTASWDEAYERYVILTKRETGDW